MNRIPYRSQIDFNFSLKFWFLPLNQLLLSIIDILILFNPSLIFRHSTIIDLIQYSNYTKLSPQSQPNSAKEKKGFESGKTKATEEKGKRKGRKIVFRNYRRNKGHCPAVMCQRQRIPRAGGMLREISREQLTSARSGRI